MRTNRSGLGKWVTVFGISGGDSSLLSCSQAGREACHGESIRAGEEGDFKRKKVVRSVNGRRERVLSAVWRKKNACLKISLFRFDFRIF